jgi:hypothetical protein
VIKRDFMCDLCHEARKPVSGELIGLSWRYSGLVAHEHPQSTEHHVCHDCAMAIANFILSTRGRPEAAET